VNTATTAITGPGIYNITMPISTGAGHVVQYGIRTTGVNVWPGDECGSLKATAVELPESDGCLATLGDIEVQMANPITIDETLVTAETCFEACDGTVTVTATSDETLEYSVDGGPYGVLNSFTGLCAGEHTVTVRYANMIACTFPVIFTVDPGMEVCRLVE